MENMEKMENLATALMDAMQNVGGKVNILSSVLIGETTQFDSTTTIDKLIRVLKANAEEMHEQNEQMRWYTQALEAHTKALNDSATAMSRHTRAMEDHDQVMQRHINSMRR